MVARDWSRDLGQSTARSNPFAVQAVPGARRIAFDFAGGQRVDAVGGCAMGIGTTVGSYGIAPTADFDPRVCSYGRVGIGAYFQTLGGISWYSQFVPVGLTLCRPPPRYPPPS
eukprot:2271901-Rhodomonas_salina.1